jgi:hypothetical protein
LKQLNAEIQNSGGIAQKSGDEITKGFGGALQKLQSAWEVGKIRLGEALAPGVEEATKLLVNFSQGLINSDGLFRQLNQTSQEFQNFLKNNPGLIAELNQQLERLVSELLAGANSEAQKMLAYLKQNPSALSDAVKQAGELLTAFLKAGELLSNLVKTTISFGNAVKPIGQILGFMFELPLKGANTLLQLTQQILNVLSKPLDGNSWVNALKNTGNILFGGNQPQQGQVDTGTLLGITGDTGRSSGPHLDLRYARSYDPNRRRPSDEHLNRFLVDGKPLASYGITSEHRSRNSRRPGHDGIDFGTPVGGKITSNVPIKSVSKPTWDTGGGGWYTIVTFTDGVQIGLLHQDPSVQSAGVGKTKTAYQGSALRQGSGTTPIASPRPTIEYHKSPVQQAQESSPTPDPTPQSKKSKSSGDTPTKSELKQAEKKADEAIKRQKNLYQYLARIAAGESAGGTNIGPNPETGAFGEYQFTPDTRRLLMNKAPNLDPWSKSKGTRDQAALKWIELYGQEIGTDILALIKKGEFEAVDKLLGKPGPGQKYGQFTSLPGGTEASKIWNNPANLRKYAPIGQVEGTEYYDQAMKFQEDAEKKAKEAQEKAREILESARKRRDTQLEQQQKIAVQRLEDEQKQKLLQFDWKTSLMPEGEAKAARATERDRLERENEAAKERLEIEQALTQLLEERRQKMEDTKAQKATPDLKIETDARDITAEINALKVRKQALESNLQLENIIAQNNTEQELAERAKSLNEKVVEVNQSVAELKVQYADDTAEARQARAIAEVNEEFDGHKQAIVEAIKATVDPNHREGVAGAGHGSGAGAIGTTESQVSGGAGYPE